MGVAQSSEIAHRRPARNAVRDLRGIGRDMFTAVGGGERWLRKERDAFDAVLAGDILCRLDSPRVCLRDHRGRSLMVRVDPVHPGEHLAEILDELGISQYRLARAIGVPPRRINDIVRGRRSVTADTALRIGRALAMTPEFWLNLQRMYDLDRARATADISAIESLVAAG